MFSWDRMRDHLESLSQWTDSTRKENGSAAHRRPAQHTIHIVTAGVRLSSVALRRLCSGSGPSTQKQFPFLHEALSLPSTE